MTPVGKHFGAKPCLFFLLHAILHIFSKHSIKSSFLLSICCKIISYELANEFIYSEFIYIYLHFHNSIDYWLHSDKLLFWADKNMWKKKEYYTEFPLLFPMCEWNCQKWNNYRDSLQVSWFLCIICTNNGPHTHPKKYS